MKYFYHQMINMLLATSAIAVASMASPAYIRATATNNPQLQQNYQQKPKGNIQQVGGREKKAEKAFNDYFYSLEQACEDKVIKWKELEILNAKLDNYFKFSNQGKREAVFYSDATEERTARNEKLESLLSSLGGIISNYPGLVDDKASINYSSSQKLNPQEGETLRKVVGELDDITGKNQLKEDATIENLARLYFFVEKQAIAHREVKEVPVKKEDIVTYNLNDYRKKYAELLKKREKLKSYLIAPLPLDETTVAFKATLKDCIKEQGFDAEIEKSYKDFPSKFKFPNWLSYTIAFLAVPLRAIAIAKYTKKYSGLDFAENLINTLAGGILLDCLHPLIFPIRVLAVPLITQPLNKIYKIE